MYSMYSGIKPSVFFDVNFTQLFDFNTLEFKVKSWVEKGVELNQ